MAAKRGRPPIPAGERHVDALHVRLTRDEREKLESVAGTERGALSEWARGVLLRTAARATRRKRSG